MKYLKNPGVTFTVLHGASSSPSYMCEVPQAKGSFRRYAIPCELAELLSLFNGARDIEAVLEEHKLLYPRSQYTVEKVRRLVSEHCLPNSLLIDPSITNDPSTNNAAVPDKTVSPSIPSSRYMYAKFKIFSHSVVYPLARRLSWLYLRPVLLFFFFLSVLMHVWFYWRLLPASRFNIGAISGLQMMAVFALTIAAAFCHEMGHATALAAHGCKRLQIGFGLYLYLPVLYTDVSEAWRLKPMERALVDVGGIYFHCLSELALLASFYIWHSSIFLYAIFLIDITITSSLNPFLRMDGYWLLTDLCGLWNLRKQSLQLLQYSWQKIASRSAVHAMLDLPPRVIGILSVYTVIFTLFFGYLLITMADQMVVHVLPEYPGLWLRFASDVAHPASLHLALFLHTLFELLWKSALIFGCFMFLKNSLRTAINWMIARRRKKAVNAGVTEETYRYPI